MKFFTTSRTYSLITLKPKSKEDSAQFWDFRSEDVRECYHYIFAMSVMTWFVILGLFLINPTDEDALQKVFMQTLYFLGQSAVWLIGF